MRRIKYITLAHLSERFQLALVTSPESELVRPSIFFPKFTEFCLVVLPTEGTFTGFNKALLKSPHFPLAEFCEPFPSGSCGWPIEGWGKFAFDPSSLGASFPSSWFRLVFSPHALSSFTAWVFGLRKMCMNSWAIKPREIRKARCAPNFVGLGGFCNYSPSEPFCNNDNGRTFIFRLTLGAKTSFCFSRTANKSQVSLQVQHSESSYLPVVSGRNGCHTLTAYLGKRFESLHGWRFIFGRRMGMPIWVLRSVYQHHSIMRFLHGSVQEETFSALFAGLTA